MFDASTLLSEPIFSCATCMGDSGSLINQAAGYAIAFMLVMLFIVLGCLIKFMSYLSKMEKGGTPVPVPVQVDNDRDLSN